MSYVKTKEARETLGVCAITLRKWDKEGKIKTIRGGGNHRRYDVESFLRDTDEKEKGKKYIYCRVSSSKQKEDLDRQVEYLSEKYPEHIVLKEIACSINSKRKVLSGLLEESHKGMVTEVVVAHKDRLCRISWDHFEWLFRLYGVNLLVDGDQKHSPDSELAEDLMSIVHVFSCRHYGQRRRCRTKESPNPETEDASETGESDSRSPDKERSEKKQKNNPDP